MNIKKNQIVLSYYASPESNLRIHTPSYLRIYFHKIKVSQADLYIFIDIHIRLHYTTKIATYVEHMFVYLHMFNICLQRVLNIRGPYVEHVCTGIC